MLSLTTCNSIDKLKLRDCSEKNKSTHKDFACDLNFMGCRQMFTHKSLFIRSLLHTLIAVNI